MEAAGADPKMIVQSWNGRDVHAVGEMVLKPLQSVLVLVQKLVARFSSEVHAIPPPLAAQEHSKH